MTTPANPTNPSRIALVMSGGGARGAYEAGVLSHLFGPFAARLGRPVHFDIVTGTSVGAVHACFVAGGQQDASAAQRLVDSWLSLSLDRVFDIGATDLIRVPWRLLHLSSPVAWLPANAEALPDRLPGLFDTAWLETLVRERIDWNQLRRNLEDGSLLALALTATEIATGRSVVFVDNRSGALPPWAHDPYVVARPANIRAVHALASAAIPLVFPAIRIDRTYYCDGGLRLNTPLSPALRLGADRVLVIGLRYPRSPQEEDRLARRRVADYASPAYLVGKALNALLLDRIEYDLDRLRLFNAILDTGVRAYGPDFLVRINEAIIEQRNAPYRIVRNFFLRPSRDLGELAADCLRHQSRSRGLREWLSRNVIRYAGGSPFAEADLVSYLLFDRCYAEHLIELGRSDAERAGDDLMEFFS